MLWSMAKEVGSDIAIVVSDTLRVRKEADLESGVYGLIGKAFSTRCH